MNLANMLIAAIIGGLVGFVIARLTSREHKAHEELKADLDKSRFELEQNRQDLNDHFAKTANLLENISKDYVKLYDHMAKTSVELLPNHPIKANPFHHAISHTSTDKSDAKPSLKDTDKAANPPKDTAKKQPKDKPKATP